MDKAMTDADQSIANTHTHFPVFAIELKVADLQKRGKYLEAADQLEILAASDNSYARAIASSAPIIRSKAIPDSVALWRAFDDNVVAAEDAYKDKKIAINGIIASVTASETGLPQVNLRVDSQGINKVACELRKEDRPQIAKLEKDQSIFVVGICTGITEHTVGLKDCRVW